MPVCLCVYMSVCLSVCVSVCHFLCLSVSLCISVVVYMCVLCVYIYLPVWMCLCLSECIYYLKSTRTGIPIGQMSPKHTNFSCGHFFIEIGWNFLLLVRNWYGTDDIKPNCIRVVQKMWKSELRNTHKQKALTSWINTMCFSEHIEKK